MHIYLSIIVLLRAIAEGGEGEPSIPVYQLASLYWWGALLIISLVIFVAWLLISWQARYFDHQLVLAGSQSAHHPPTEETQAAPILAPEVSVHPPLPSTPQTPDDLTLIEGIGPVISRLLQSKGILTFDALAQADPRDLDRYLREANLRLANTSSWSEQARLAALGDFDGLNAYQSRLKGGREV